MPASATKVSIDHLPAKDVFLAEVFAALEDQPASAVAELVDAELRRKHDLSVLAEQWERNGHAFDRPEYPETQGERANRYGWCLACGYLVHSKGALTTKGAATCAPARIGLR